jgi:hypothetical protein
VIVGLCLVISYFYLLSFLLGDASPDRGPGGSDDPNEGGRRRLLLWGEAYTAQGIYSVSKEPCTKLYVTHTFLFSLTTHIHVLT